MLIIKEKSDSMDVYKTVNVTINSPLPQPYERIHIFDRPENYLMEYHSHNDRWHINYVMEGSLELFVNDKCVTIHKNQLFILPPKLSHKIISHNGYSQIGVDIIHENDDRNIWRMINAYCTTFPLVLNVTPPAVGFRAAAELIKNPLPLNISSFLNMYERVILDALNIISQNKKSISAKLTQIISENNPLTLTLSDICRITNYSKTQIERLAIKELGCGITAYLNNIRINEICSLLQNTDYTMSEIAERTGLYDASHLTTFFKKHMGVTPGKFRKEHLEMFL